MDDNKRVPEAPATFEQWRTDLRKAADTVMQAGNRPAKAGAIAGALTACAGRRSYDHSDVVHAPTSSPNITIATSQERATSLANKLKTLNLPGIADIEVVPYGEGDRAEVRITPFPRPLD